MDGNPIEEQSKAKIAADQAAGAVSLLIRIGHKVCMLCPFTKPHSLLYSEQFLALLVP